MTFDSDAFISYAHLDNQPLIEGHTGWVADFHRALEIRIGQLRGKAPQIWRDPKLAGNDYFAETLVERLHRVASLVSIFSPPYIHSEWTRKELTEFWKAADESGGVRVGDKARVFKILKSPVPLERQPPEVQALLGYEFFKLDQASGRVRELDKVFGEEAQREFWMKLDDLAHDMCMLLEQLEHDEEASPGKTLEKGTIYLAETTVDMRDEQAIIRRELQQQGYVVLPAFSLPVVESELRAVVRAQLDRSQMSIHLVGEHYSLVPEGGLESLVEIQNDLAIERAARGGFPRLVWIPAGLETKDERQRKLIQQLRMNPRLHEGSDLLETPLEGLKTAIEDRLRPPQNRTSNFSGTATASKDLTYLYLIYDERDREAVLPWQQFLFEQGIEVLHPDFEGDETQVRECHDDNLRNCDAVLIHYGSASESWLRRKQREVQKSAGYGRTRLMRAIGISLAPPRTPQKESFRTHEAIVIPQWDGCSPDLLLPFVQQLLGQTGAPAGG